MPITLDVQSDIVKGLKAIYWAHPDQFPKSVSYVLNETAKEALQAVKTVMPAEIAQPTPFTLNSLRIDYANDKNLTSSVLFKDFAAKGTSAGKYLRPIIEGGSRRLKRFERALQANGYLPNGLYAVPAQGVPLNAYGNLPASFYSRILSYLRASPDAHQNRTERSRKRNKKLQQFFVINAPNERGLPLGIYQRKSEGIRMVIAFVKQPHYRKQFKFYETAENTAKIKLPLKLKEAAERAQASAQRSANNFVASLFK